MFLFWKSVLFVNPSLALVPSTLNNFGLRSATSIRLLSLTGIIFSNVLPSVDCQIPRSQCHVHLSSHCAQRNIDTQQDLNKPSKTMRWMGGTLTALCTVISEWVDGVVACICCCDKYHNWKQHGEETACTSYTQLIIEGRQGRNSSRSRGMYYGGVMLAACSALLAQPASLRNTGQPAQG